MRHLSLAAILLTTSLTMVACDRSSDTTTTTTPPNNATPTSTETTVTTSTADTQPATSSASNMPGLPSVNGTSVKGLSTPDAAATRLLDAAKNDLSKGSYSTARTLLGELKQKGMYDSLSAPIKSQVDQLETDLNNASPATQPK